MTIVIVYIPAMLSGAAIGMALFVNRRYQAQLRLALRRERWFVELVGDCSKLLEEEAPLGQFCAAWNRCLLPLFDEIHNQQRHQGDFWPRVPRLGKEWPDFEPASIVMEEDDG